MKKQILFAFIYIFSVAAIYGQGPYTSAEFGVAGDSLFYTSVNVDTSTLNFARAGANAVWNFSTLAPTTQYNVDYLTPATAGYKTTFVAECIAAGGTPANCNSAFNSLTNVAFHNQNNINIHGTVFTNVTAHDLKTVASLETNILGVTTKINGVNVLFTSKYITPDIVCVFPINYQNRDSSVSSYIIDLTQRGLNFVYHAHSKRLNYSDAYGSLTTPYATYASTVRLRSYIQHTDTLFYNNAVIPIVPYTSFEYKWFDASYVGPVCTASGNFAGAQQKFTTVTYLDVIHCLAPHASQHHTPLLPTINPSAGNVTVNFNNFSTNANSYTWNFGNPASGGLNTSTATNPTHSYDSAGVYTLQLVACNTACQPEKCDTQTFTINVVDSGQLHASFIVNPSVACIQDTVKFKNTSTNATSYQWSFGDQFTSTLKNPFHIYTLPGSYTVTLVVKNGTQTDTTTRTVTVNAPPAAQINATGPTTFCNGDSVTLYGSGGTVYHWSNGHVGPTIKVKATGTFTVTVTNSCGSSTSAPFTVTVNTPVDTVTAQGSTNICTGDSVKLTVNSGNGATYQWKRNGQIIAGATQATYYAKTTGNYMANVIQNSCTGVSNTVHVAVSTPPAASIFTQGSTTLCTGDSLKLFAATAAGNTYQWQNNGVAITGATASTYFAKTGGSFTALVTRNGCPATSNSIIVTSVATPQPVVTSHGGNSTCQGDSIYLTTAAGNGYTYQWLQNGNNIIGAVSQYYYAGSAGSYSVVATFNGCAGRSQATVITINPTPGASAGNPQSLTGCSFSTVNIGGNPTASGGTGPYTYAWSPVAGLNDSSVANPTVSQIGVSTNYTVVVTDSKGCTAQSSALITVTGSSLSVSITRSADTTWCFGTNGSVTLTAVPAGGTSPFIYNWSPATNLTSTNTAATTANPSVVGVYNYNVLVIDHNGCQASANVPVTVSAIPTATVTALDTTVPCAGDTVHFTAAPGSGYAYQWLNNSTPVNGATGINYAVAAAGSYSVSVTAGICSATSSTVTVTTRPNATAIIQAPTGTAICTGGSDLLAASTGAGYSYQWFQNGYGIAGATSATYLAGDSGSYYADVTLGGCITQSNTLNISVIPNPFDSVSALGATTFCTGDSVVLSASTGNGYLYQWLNNNGNIGGANDSVFTATASGSYSAMIISSGCSSTSTAISVTVYQYPPATLTAAGNLTFCGGDSVTLNATSSNAYNYQWFNNVGGNLDSLADVTSSVTVGDSGSYYVVISQNLCRSVSNTLYANELQLPASGAFITGSGFVCPGDTVALSAISGAGYTYQWQRDGININGATSSIYYAADSGAYAVVETGGGCSAPSNFVFVSYDSCTTGIATIIESGSISVYPNPAHDAAMISLNSDQPGNIAIKLFDMMGKQVLDIYEGKTVAGNNIYSIPMANLSEGMYLVRLYDGLAVTTRKLIKE